MGAGASLSSRKSACGSASASSPAWHRAEAASGRLQGWFSDPGGGASSLQHPRGGGEGGVDAAHLLLLPGPPSQKLQGARRRRTMKSEGNGVHVGEKWFLFL